MDNNSEYSMIVSMYADKESAKETAKMLVEKRLAACVQMLPVESVYAWRGNICDDDEIALFIKTRTGLFDEVAAAIKENHAYEVPEIIQVPITEGTPEYLKWIGDCTKG